mgnify:FL=1
MIKHELFPTLVLQDHFSADDNGELLNTIINRKSGDHYKLKQIIPELPPQLYGVHKDPEFEWVRARAVSTAKKWVQYSGLEDLNLKVTDMWTTTYDGKTNLTQHNHPNAFLSAVYYLSDNNNQLVLIDPAGVAKWQIMPKVIDQSKFKGPYHVIQPNKGDMIIFPSWMYHSVQTNAYYKKRTTGGRGVEEETVIPAVTIAMNLSIVGGYGDKDLHTFNENI